MSYIVHDVHEARAMFVARRRFSASSRAKAFRLATYLGLAKWRFSPSLPQQGSSARLASRRSSAHWSFALAEHTEAGIAPAKSTVINFLI
jgi:hypothetical protein